MPENRQKEFIELQNIALAKLEDFKEGPTENFDKDCYPIIRLWHYPSFDIHRSWMLFYPKDYSPNNLYTIAREIKWNRPKDYKRLFDPLEGIKHGFQTNPSIEINDAIIKLNELNQMLEALRKIIINIFIEDKSVVIDGEIFGLESIGLMSTINLTWWCDGPKEWKELTEWAAQMRNFLISHFTPWPD